ncbi:SBBP repeat-containing protein [Acanthopleuribacter pedis]
MFSTFLGGSSFDDIAGLVLDGNGDIIVAGSTFSNDFPASNGAFDQTLSGTNDGFVAKLDAAGANLMFATYLGGSSTEDVVGVAVDSEGNAYLAGTTASSNFPASLGGVQENFGGVLDAFIVKVNATGTNLEFATFLGGTGTDEAFGMNLDLDNQVIVVGKTHSADYPTSASGFDRALGGNVDAFVTKIDSTGTTLRFSTFLGGSSGDAAFDVAVDGAGAVYVTGDTQAEDFPTTGGVFDPDFNGSNDVYVAKLDPTGANLTYATYIGGSQEEGGVAVAVDGAGNAYVTGFTRSSDFPTTAGAFSQTLTGTSDVFVTKLNATGTALSYSSFLGGDGFERATDIAVDGAGNAHVVGATFASDFPTTGGAFDTTFASSSDGFVTKFNATGTALLYSTLLGTTGGAEVAGIALDGAGNAALAGTTGAADFPTTAGAYDETANGDDDVFVSLLNVTGTNLIFSTLLGGSGQDTATGIAIGQNDDLYVTGYTRSSSFPITGGAFDTSFSGVYEGFAARIASAGNALTYATYLGGSRSDYPASIAVDSDDRAVITGQTESTNFPTTTNAFDRSANGGTDAFVTLLSDDGTQSLYSSYLGGADEDYGNGVVFDPSGNGVVVGSTRSSEFPTTAGSFKPNPGGVGDGFVTAICFDLPDPAGAITGSTTFCSGQTGVTYSVAAVTGATGYTWTVPFGATITAGQGTTSITVTFGTIAGNVTVAAENACGPSPRAELAVTLSGGVSFTTQPSDVTTCPTEQVQFSVVAEGAGSLTYQWYKDNVLLGGETSADLVLASVTSADAGSYQCEVTDSCSSLRSDAALLTISGLADVSVQPVSQGLGLNPPEFEVNLACAGINTTTLWSADPATTLVTNGGMVTLNPPPSVSTQVTATVRDTDTNAETTASAWLLVSPNTGYDDANGDGCNNIADLWELTPFWQRPFENDPDGNGFIDVRDFLYLNLTDPFPCPL